MFSMTSMAFTGLYQVIASDLEVFWKDLPGFGMDVVVGSMLAVHYTFCFRALEYHTLILFS